MFPSTEISIYFKKGSSKNFPSRAYDSVDETSQSWVMSRKTMKKEFGP